MKQVDKVFADGIQLEDELEECSVRQYAYCYSLGLSPEYIHSHQSALYYGLLKMSQARNENHKERMDAYKAVHGANARLPLDDCCEEETRMCKVIRQIRRDVPRTSSTFAQIEQLNLSLHTGKNPVYNLLVAYAELDRDLGYTQGMNFLAGIIFVAVQDEVMAFSILQRIMQSKSQA